MKRFGKFSIARTLIEDYPEEIMSLLSECIVIKCEMDYESDALHYTAISQIFHPIPKGCVPIHYEILVEDVAKSKRAPHGKYFSFIGTV